MKSFFGSLSVLLIRYTPRRRELSFLQKKIAYTAVLYDEPSSKAGLLDAQYVV